MSERIEFEVKVEITGVLPIDWEQAKTLQRLNAAIATLGSEIHPRFSNNRLEGTTTAMLIRRPHEITQMLNRLQKIVKGLGLDIAFESTGNTRFHDRYLQQAWEIETGDKGRHLKYRQRKGIGDYYGLSDGLPGLERLAPLAKGFRVQPRQMLRHVRKGVDALYLLYAEQH